MHRHDPPCRRGKPLSTTRPALITAPSSLPAGNPLQDISAVRRPLAVFKGDRRYDPAQRCEAVGIRPFTRQLRAGGKT